MCAIGWGDCFCNWACALFMRDYIVQTFMSLRDMEIIICLLGSESKLFDAHTKRPETKRPKTKRPTDKTSQGTNRPKQQNVLSDKTSQGTKKAHYLTWVGQLPNPIRSR